MQMSYKTEDSFEKASIVVDVKVYNYTLQGVDAADDLNHRNYWKLNVLPY